MLALCLASPARADEAGRPLKAGEPAPFAGQLLTTEAAVSLVVKLEQAEDRKAAELTHLIRLHEAELRYLKEQGDARVDAEKQRSDLWRTEAEAGRAWYREPRLWFIVGAVVGVALAAGGTAAAVAVVEARR